MTLVMNGSVIILSQAIKITAIIEFMIFISGIPQVVN